MNKEEIIEKIDSLKEELVRLNIKTQCYTETISHLRSRVERCERRKAEIHNEVIDLKDKVRAWQAIQDES